MRHVLRDAPARLHCHVPCAPGARTCCLCPRARRALRLTDLLRWWWNEYVPPSLRPGGTALGIDRGPGGVACRLPPSPKPQGVPALHSPGGDAVYRSNRAYTPGARPARLHVRRGQSSRVPAVSRATSLRLLPLHSPGGFGTASTWDSGGLRAAGFSTSTGWSRGRWTRTAAFRNCTRW